MEKAAAFAHTYKVEAHAPEVMAAAEDIDVIAVATPPGVHLEDTLQAIAGGKHVLVEKPFALTLENCDRMIEAAGREDRLLMRRGRNPTGQRTS